MKIKSSGKKEPQKVNEFVREQFITLFHKYEKQPGFWRSQTSFSRDIGEHQQTINAIVGRKIMVSVYHIDRMYKVYGINPMRFFDITAPDLIKQVKDHSQRPPAEVEFEKMRNEIIKMKAELYDLSKSRVG